MVLTYNKKCDADDADDSILNGDNGHDATGGGYPPCNCVPLRVHLRVGRVESYFISRSYKQVVCSRKTRECVAVDPMSVRGSSPVCAALFVCVCVCVQIGVCSIGMLANTSCPDRFAGNCACEHCVWKTCVVVRFVSLVKLFAYLMEVRIRYLLIHA